MKTQLTRVILSLTLLAGVHRAAAQGTAFTYQGRLNSGGNPANGSYDLVFSLYTVASGGPVAEGPVTNSPTAVSNGLFTVTLDFGDVFYGGSSYWLDISVRTNGNGSFAELSPRQPLTPTPYAIHSESAANATLADSVAGGVIGPNAFQVGAGPTAGQVLSYNGSLLAWTNVGAGGGSEWSLTGNSGTTGSNFLGTLDNQPLELWVNGARMFRLEPGGNVIGGYSSTVGSYVGSATIAGGSINTVSANSGNGPTIGGGLQNTVSNLYPTVSGGEYNLATANGASIGGGYNNTASGREATVGGGAQNVASADGSFVGGGGYNGFSVAGNTASSPGSTVVGGLGNTAGGNGGSFVGGGANNIASGQFAVVGGGLLNAASGLEATVPGGVENQAFGDHSFAAGTVAQALNMGAFVWADSLGTPFYSTADNQFSVRASGGVRFVTGGAGMTIDGVPVGTGGGGGGSTNGWLLTGNAGANPASGFFLGTLDSFPLELRIKGQRGLRLEYSGSDNQPNFIGGSSLNSVLGGMSGATIGGGFENTNGGNYGTIGGGTLNKIGAGGFATVGGGENNTAGGGDATVPGGYNNSANGNGSFAAGRNAHASYDGSFVWGDGSAGASDNAPNEFQVLATGGVGFYTGGGNGLAITKGSGPYGTAVGINTTTPRQALDVNGGWVEVQGNGAQAAIGGLGSSEVDIGSFNSSVSSVAFVNLSSFAPMNIKCCSITIQGGCDLAEPFQMSAAEQEVTQGAVVVIDEKNPGHLKLSNRAYDTRVAGVVSGANGINPGIQMQQQGLLEGGKNVALTGRVYVLADASNGPIEPGDLLTSSTIPGHAMKVSDHAKAQGAILGKAMTELSEGKGMVLVLVTLQ